jgi:hypothetical protein
LASGASGNLPLVPAAPTIASLSTSRSLSGKELS